MKTLFAMLLAAWLLSACSLAPVHEAPGAAGLEPQAVAGNRVVNNLGQTIFGAPPFGLTYTKAASYYDSSYVLRSDGRILSYAPLEAYCPFVFPSPPAGMRYTDFTAYGLALRSDGQVLSWDGANCDFTPVYTLPKDSSFIAVVGSRGHGMALRSSGTIATWGDNTFGQRNVPALPAGLRYTVIAGASTHFALRSDGQIIVWGRNDSGQFNVPLLPAGVRYTSLSATSEHAVALRSDGQVVTWGESYGGAIPPLPAGVIYTQAEVCAYCNVLLRSDGQIVTTGHLEALADPAFSPLLLGSRYLAVAGGDSQNLAIVRAPIVPKYTYAITLDGLTSGKIVSSVSLGRGVISGDGRSVNPNPIQVSGIVKGSSESRAVVVGATTNKSLALLGASRTSVSGGTLALSFVPSFNSQGVTVKSLKVTRGSCSPSLPGFPCLPIKLTVGLYAVDGTSRTVPLTLGLSLTVNLGDTGVKAMQVSSSAPFAIDDVVFGE